MSNGVCLLILIFCFLCGGLDIFMAVTSYKKRKIFWDRYVAYYMGNPIDLPRGIHYGILIRENYS